MAENNTVNFAELLESAVNDPGVVSKAYSAFYGYSMGNQMLAWLQCLERGIQPGPIATFMGWKDKGRFVRKGEKAITLCMPITCKRPAEQPGEQNDGSDPNMVAFTRFVFKPHWFVLAQTDGDPLAESIQPAMWNRERALETLNISEEPFGLLDGNTQGYARERTIAVSPVAEMPFKTTFHELAHVVLGHTSEGQQNDDERTPRTLREVEAESVALLCCAALELPGAEESRGYIQHWGGQGNEIPEKSAQKIMKAADQILKAGTQPADKE